MRLSTSRIISAIVSSVLLAACLLLPHVTHAQTFLGFDISELGAAFANGLLGVLDKVGGVILGLLGSFTLLTATIVLKISAMVFNLAFEFSIFRFSDFINNTPAITTSWAVLRNFVNVCLIFVILYVAISIILQLNSGNAKKIITQVIVVALLINFSLFFTKLVIDTSNILGYEFYRLSVPAGATNTGTIKIAETFGSNLGLSWGAIGDSASNVASWQNLNTLNVVNQFFGKAAIMFVTSFVFWAGAILMAIRIVVLILLMVLSPLAFMAYAIPGLQGQFSKWWKRLLNEAFWFPAYMFFIFLTTEILNTGVLNARNGSSSAIVGATAAAGGPLLGGLFSTMIVITIMLASLIAAKTLGATAAKSAMTQAGSITGWLTKRTGGTLQNIPRILGNTAGGAAGAVTGAISGVGSGTGVWGRTKGLFTGAYSGAQKTGTAVGDALQKPIDKAVASTLKVTSKIPGVGKPLANLIKQPTQFINDQLAAATKETGIPGVLGKTVDEEKEAKKKEKEAKEEARKEELQAKTDELKDIKRWENNKGRQDEARTKVAEILGGMSAKEISGLDGDILEMDSVVYNLTPEPLKLIGREGKKTKTFNSIIAKILKDEDHPAYNYAKTSPSRTLRGAQPTTPPATPTNPSTPTQPPTTP
jgi:hypothetical protein